MSWTYISKLDEVDHELTADQQVEGRFTFHKNLYFKPDEYDDWVSGNKLDSIPYSAELIGHSAIPKRGDYLSGSLSAFYLSHVVSISNLTSVEHGVAGSYGVVTLEYENLPSKGGGSSSSNNVKDVEPWKEKVADFTVTWQESSEPMVVAYIDDQDTMVPVETTAHQPLYDFTAPVWTGRATWTFNDVANSNYSMTEPIINKEAVNLFNKFPIPAKNGLLLPPTYKKLYYTDAKGKTTEYAQWSFEIIINYKGFMIPAFNAGTKALDDIGNSYDICSWYVYTPSNNEDIKKEFGSFTEMMRAKMAVDEYNKYVSDENLKKVWSGDFVQSPVPLTSDGKIDTFAINGGEKQIRNYRNYAFGTWDLGIR